MSQVNKVFNSMISYVVNNENIFFIGLNEKVEGENKKLKCYGSKFFLPNFI